MIDFSTGTNLPLARYDPSFIFTFPAEEELSIELLLTILAGVEQMLSQVTAKHPFLEDPPLFQFLFGWSGLHEGTKEGDELAVLL